MLRTDSNSGPVIILGMHRSGTTLVTNLLRELGLFCGARRNQHAEAKFFVHRNEFILRNSGGSWDYPLPAKAALANPAVHSAAVAICRDAVESNQFAEFTGGSRFSGPNRGVLSAPWGWKDPRTIFTLSVWLNVFAGARLLYVKRNGVDVAVSLNKRAKKQLERGEFDPFSRSPLKQRLRELYQPVPRFGWGSTRCLKLEQSYALWEEYTEEGELIYDAASEPKLSFRYEELLRNPSELLPLIAEFCGLQPAESQLKAAISRIRPTRANAFLEDDETRAFYDSVRDKPLMQSLGYDAIDQRTPTA